MCRARLERRGPGPTLKDGSARAGRGWLLGATVWLAWVGLARAEEPPTLGASIRTAIAEGRIEQGRAVGFTLEKGPFSELPAEGGVLIGFDVGVGKFINIETVYALRAIYLTERGEVRYREHGSFADRRQAGNKVVRSKVLRTVRLQAPPGYAVGAVTLRTGLNINGLALTYMRIDGLALDPRQASASPWVGDRTGGREAVLTGDGLAVVGVFGNQDKEHVSALGLYTLRPPPRRPLPVPTAAPAPAPPLADTATDAPKATAAVDAAVNAPEKAQPPETKEAGGILLIVFGLVATPVFLILLVVSSRKPAEVEERIRTNHRPTVSLRPARVAVAPRRAPPVLRLPPTDESVPDVWEADLDPRPQSKEPEVTLEMVRKWAEDDLDQE